MTQGTMSDSFDDIYLDENEEICGVFAQIGIIFVVDYN